MKLQSTFYPYVTRAVSLSALGLSLSCVFSTSSMADSSTECVDDDLAFQSPKTAVEYLRNSLNSDIRLDKECIFSKLNELPNQFKFVVPFYYVWQNASDPAFLSSVDYLEAERLFHGFLGLNAAVDASFDRYGAYTTYLYEVIAPVDKLPFFGTNNRSSGQPADDRLDVLKCFILNDDLVSPPNEVVSSLNFKNCTGG